MLWLHIILGVTISGDPSLQKAYYSAQYLLIYLFIYLQKAKKLNVFKNDDETWDYTGALSNVSGLWRLFTEMLVVAKEKYLDVLLLLLLFFFLFFCCCFFWGGVDLSQWL